MIMREKISSIQPVSYDKNGLRVIAGTALLIIPASIAQDTAFPFMLHEKVMVRIEDKRLVVEKVNAEKVP